MTILLRDDSLDLQSCFRACQVALRNEAPELNRRLLFAGEGLRTDAAPVLLWIVLALRTSGVDAKDFEGRRRRSDLARELEAAAFGQAVSPLGRALHGGATRRGLDLSGLAGLSSALDDELQISVFETRDEVLAHARRRSEAVSEIFDALFGRPSERSRVLARSLGVGLQLSAWCRDFGRDWTRGRLMLPMEDLRACGVTLAQLSSGAPDDGFRRFLVREAAWARTWIAKGWELCGEWSHVRGRVLAFHLRRELFRLAALEQLGQRALREAPRASRFGTLFAGLATLGPRGLPRPLRDS